MAETETKRKPTSPTKDALRIFFRNTPAVVALFMILCLATAAITGALLTGKKPDAMESIRLEEASVLSDRNKLEVNPHALADPVTTELKDTFLAPLELSNKDGHRYWLGTDHLGRDVLARLWAGSAISLTIGFLAVGISVFLGISLGGIAGYFGRSRVSMPLLVTLLCALAGGIALAAEFPGAALALFVISGAAFALQLCVALAGKRFKTSGAFLAALGLAAGVLLYNSHVETATPEGESFQAATNVYTRARTQLLDLRDYGFRVKEFENTPEGDLNKALDKKDGKKEKPPEPPAWRVEGQVHLEINSQMLDLEVLRYDLARYAAAKETSLRLAEEQSVRGEYLLQFTEDFSERFEQSTQDAKSLRKQQAEAGARKDADAAREFDTEAAVAEARAGTFDPFKLRLRAFELQKRGGAGVAAAKVMLEQTQAAIEKYRKALDDAQDATQAILDQPAEKRDHLYERRYDMELALKNLAVAQAEFWRVDAQAQQEAAKAQAKWLRDFHKTLKFSDEAAKLKQATGESEKQKRALEQAGLLEAAQANVAAEADASEKADEERKKAVEEKKTAETKATEAVKAHTEFAKRLNKALAMKEGDERDKELADINKTIKPIALQGSNDLVDRRGKFRKAFVEKYDTEAKNRRTDLLNSELLDGNYRYGTYRILRHFLAYLVLALLVIVTGMGVLASAQATVSDQFKGLRHVFLPTITVDDLVMRFTEIMLTIPVIFLILAVLAMFEKDVYITMGVIGLTSWMGTTRFVRAEILSLREQDFIQAARSLGVSDFRIIWRHLVPNAISPVLVSASIGVAGAVLAESTLSFLGIGAGPNQSTWGSILSEGREFINDAAWLTWIPGVAILITVLSFNLLGEGLREAFNPKLRGR